MSATNTIFFNFKDLLNLPLTNSMVTLTPLIYPIATGSLTILNDPVVAFTDITGSVYFNNIVLPNLFKLDYLLSNKKAVVTYYAGVPTASNDNIPFNASTYIISASIDNGAPTDITFDLGNVISEPYAVKKVRLTPSPSYIPNVNSGSVVPGNFKEFDTDGTGIFTASMVVPGGYDVQCFSYPKKNIPVFSIKVPSNSGSLNVNQVIVPSSTNQINISYPFINGPGQSLTIQQLFATFQTIIQSGSFFDISVTSSSFANMTLEAVSASWADSSSVATYAISGGSGLVSASLYNITASWAQMAQFATQSNAVTADFAVVAGTALVVSQSLFATSSIFAVSASNTVSSSFAQKSALADTASFAAFAGNVAVVNAVSSSIFASSSISASYAASASVTVSSSFAAKAHTADFANSFTQSTAVNNFVPKWHSGLLSDSSSIVDNGTQVTVSANVYVPYLQVQQSESVATPFSVINALPWLTPVFKINLPDDLNPDVVIQGNNTASFIKIDPTGSVTFNNVGDVFVLHNVTASNFVGTLIGTASWATNAITATIALQANTASLALNANTASFFSGPVPVGTASFAITSAYALTASTIPPNSTLYDDIILWDAQSGNFVGFGKFPSLGVQFFWQTGSLLDAPVPIFRTVGSQSVWFGVQQFNTASGFWFGTASVAQNATTTSYALVTQTANTAVLANTASYANRQTSSTFFSDITIITGSNAGASLTLTAQGLGGGSSTLLVNPSGLVVTSKLLVAGDVQGNDFIGDGSQLTEVTAALLPIGAGFGGGTVVGNLDPLGAYIGIQSAGGNTIVIRDTLNDVEISVPVVVSGDVTATSFIGPLEGTASWANTASWAQNANTASFATNAKTASFVVLSTVSASWASSSLSSSYAKFASTASTAILANALITSSAAQDLTLQWNPNVHSYYQQFEHLGDSLQFWYGWNDGGNAEMLMSLSTASVNIPIVQLQLGTVQSSILYADNSGFVGALPIALPVAITASYAANVNGYANDTSSYVTLPMTSSSFVVNQRKTGSYYGVFYEYVARSGSNSRIGTVFGTWNGSSISYTETDAVDVGDTSALTMAMALSNSFSASATNSFVQLIATVVGSNNTSISWSFRANGRYL